MSSQPRQSAPTPTSDTSSAPESTQQIKPNTGFDQDPDRLAELQAEYDRDARDDPRDDQPSAA